MRIPSLLQGLHNAVDNKHESPAYVNEQMGYSSIQMTVDLSLDPLIQPASGILLNWRAGEVSKKRRLPLNIGEIARVGKCTRNKGRFTTERCMLR